MATIKRVIIVCLFTLGAAIPALAQTEPAVAPGATSAFRSAASLPPAVGRLPQSPAADDPGALAGKFVNEKLAVWRHRLNLDDWKISVVLARRSDMKPKTLGGTRWDKDKKSAVIWVMDPSDYTLPLPEMLKDMEFTLVHELVHLELVSLPHSEASRSNEEHAVNRIAEALLALDRQN